MKALFYKLFPNTNMIVFPSLKIIQEYQSTVARGTPAGI